MENKLQFIAEQTLPYPPELVFAFFANPENLPRLMPPWQATRMEQAMFAAPPPRPAGSPGSRSIAAGDGTKITLSLRPFPYSPVRITWEALIQDFVWDHGFCDLQLRGPFLYWRHCHTVEVAKNVSSHPATLLRDTVRYELPFGPLNTLADKLVVRRMLAYLFRYRQKRTEELLAVATGRAVVSFGKSKPA